MTFLYMLWIGLIWFFGWLGWKLIKSGNVIAIFFGIIMMLIAVGLCVFLIIVAFLNS
jgi:hypothetical protein